MLDKKNANAPPNTNGTMHNDSMDILDAAPVNIAAVALGASIVVEPSTRNVELPMTVVLVCEAPTMDAMAEATAPWLEDAWATEMAEEIWACALESAMVEALFTTTLEPEAAG